MKVKRIIRKITEEQKQKEIRICLPGFFTKCIDFSYSDFKQQSLEELVKKWIIETKESLKWAKKWAKGDRSSLVLSDEEEIELQEKIELWEKGRKIIPEELREVEEKWETYSQHKTIWRKELKELEESEEFKRLKELKEWRGKGEKKRIVEEKIKPEIIKIQEKIKNRELLRVESGDYGSSYYMYEDNLYKFDRGDYTDEQRLLLILELEDKERQNFERLKRKFSLSQETEKTPRRDAIPESVRIAVWRRDEGKCAKCGSRKNLEYDHIIPISKGGSNTVRNIELLCEECNRKKRDNIE